MHLLDLAAELERRLQERGRLQWALEECEPLERSSDERDPAGDLRAPAPCRRAERLGASVARELVDWREQTAARQDRPVQSVLSDAALMEIAKRRPSSEASSRGSAGSAAGGMRGRARRAAGGGARVRKRPPDPPPQSARRARAEARGRAAGRARGGARCAPARARPDSPTSCWRPRRPAGDRPAGLSASAPPSRGRRAHAPRLAARARGRGAARAARRPYLAVDSRTAPAGGSTLTATR